MKGDLTKVSKANEAAEAEDDPIEGLITRKVAGVDAIELTEEQAEHQNKTKHAKNNTKHLKKKTSKDEEDTMEEDDKTASEGKPVEATGPDSKKVASKKV